MVLLPDNLFYNTSAAAVIVVLSKRKTEERRGRIVLLNAGRRVRKGRPKNYIPQDDIRPLAAMFLRGNPVEGELAVITLEQAAEADYNLSPSRWVKQAANGDTADLGDIINRFKALAAEEAAVSAELESLARTTGELRMTARGTVRLGDLCDLNRRTRKARSAARRALSGSRAPCLGTARPHRWPEGVRDAE